MGELICPRCLKETPHTGLEYVAQNAQTKHGKKVSKGRIQRVGEWVKCTACSLIYISEEERNTK